MGKPESLHDTSPRVDDEVFADLDCPVCDQEPSPGSTVHCQKCSRPHHFACWMEKKGCSEPGCGNGSCRVPPTSPKPAEPFQIRRKSEPRMWFFVFFVTYVLAMYGTLFLLPEVVQDSMIFTLGVGFLFGCVTLLVTQGLVSRAYFFDPTERYVFKETQVGPVPWGRRQRWRSFDALKGIDIQVVRRSLHPGKDPSYVVQAWLRDCTGADLILREEELQPTSPQLARLHQIARMLDIHLELLVMGESDEVPLHVSRITGMPIQAREL